MSTSDNKFNIGSSIVKKRALEDVIKDENEKLEERWSEKINALKPCRLFENYKCLNGIPKREFLKKLLTINANYGAKPPSVYDLMGNLLTLLDSQDNRLKLIDTIHNLRKLMVTKEFRPDVLKWFEKCSPLKKHLFIEGIEKSLTSSSITLVEECSVFVAHLAYELEHDFHMFVTGLCIVLLNSVAVRVLSMNEYLLNYRGAYDQYLNQKLLHSKQFKFRYPRYAQPSKGVDHIGISCSIYALTFLLQYTMHPNFVLFFAKHILTMNELTRFYALKLLYLMILQVTKFLRENDNAWDDIPRKVYFELVRIYNEKNLEIKRLLRKLLDYLRSISKSRLPNYEELALRHQEEHEKIKKLLKHPSGENAPKSNRMSCLNKWRNVSKNVGLCSILARKHSDTPMIQYPRPSGILPPIDSTQEINLADNSSTSKSMKKSMFSFSMKMQSMYKKNE